MDNQILFVIICAPLLVLFVLVIPIIGTMARLRFAKRLSNALKDKNKIENWRATNAPKKLRFYSAIALVSMLVFLFLGLLIIKGILNVSPLVVTIFVILIVVDLIAGINLLIGWDKFVK
jgi:hypothetical protein